MSKYNKLPAPLEPELKEKEAQTPISKLCCLPILMEGQLKNKLKNFLSIEELLPHSGRLQIYQMLYMEKLLEELREYDLPKDEAEQNADPIGVISKMNNNKDAAQRMQTISNLIKYRQSGDISLLTSLLATQNPMFAMLLPMLSQNNSENNANNFDMLSSLLPMMPGSNTDMFSSLFNNI